MFCGGESCDYSLMAKGVARTLLAAVLMLSGHSLVPLPQQSFAPQPAGVSVWVVMIVLSLLGVIGVLVVLLIVVPAPTGPPYQGR
jgi:hypothetical protein